MKLTYLQIQATEKTNMMTSMAEHTAMKVNLAINDYNIVTSF